VHLVFLDDVLNRLGHVPDIDTTLHPDDHMVLKNPIGYFGTAVAGLSAILHSLDKAGRSPDDIGTILDFGSGYGRIYRVLAAAFPQSQLTAIDLMADGARFCAETFGGDWFKSHEDLDHVHLPRKYDLIWFGSVFTHLPRLQWDRFLAFLSANTASGGLVAFTTHGWSALTQIERKHLSGLRKAVDLDDLRAVREQLDREGFMFVPGRTNEIRHQNTRGMAVTEGLYGRSFSTPEWVRDWIAAHAEWDLVDIAQSGWGHNHDVVTIRLR
jgi:SAM-dependent methyltransferase